jgi:serine protease Do
MDEKIFIKERKGVPMIAVVLIVAIIGSFLGSAFTYVVLENKLTSSNTNNTTNTNSEGNRVKYEISSTESPVVAIAQKASPSIVGISVKSVTQNVFGSLGSSDEEGTGIIYSEDGYIITNYHVISSAVNSSNATVLVTLPDVEEPVSATVVGGDEVTDLAVLKIEKTGLTKAEFGKSSDLKVGELAVAIGNPLGQKLANSVTVGYISALNRKLTTDGRTYNLIQTDAAINPGNSGGALTNSQGQVIGINTVKIGATEVEGLGFAIPVDDALPIIEELIKNKKIVRPYIGLSGIDVNSQVAKANNIVEGIYVAKVVSNSPASKASVQKGDIITKVDGKEAKTMEVLNEIKNSKKVGDKLILTVSRAGKEIDITVTLEADDTNTSTTTNSTQTTPSTQR